MACKVVDQAPACADFVIRKGKTFNPVITIGATNLTGFTVTWDFYNADGVRIAEMSTALGNIGFALSGTDSVLTPVMSASATALLAETNGRHDMSFTAPSGTVDSYIAGKVKVISHD